MIQLAASHLRQLSAHVIACYPEEGCGLLIGQKEGDRKLVQEVLPTPNVWTPDFFAGSNLDSQLLSLSLTRCNRFAIAPQILFQVQKDLRDRHLSLIGIFHSHPQGVASPSPFDQAIAWPDYSYLILALDSHHIQSINSWQLDDNQQFIAELLDITL